jgi:hypothetical protein
MATTDKDYLVRFSEVWFYLARIPNDKKLHGTLFMSYALRMSYLVACEIALRIRKQGYGDALVTNLNGDPISYDNIPVEKYTPQRFDHYEFRDAWDANLKPLDAQIPGSVEQTLV